MIDRLAEFLVDNPGLVILTGAGCSAASGIPTYRDQEGTWRRSTPIQHQDFVRQPSSRQRYWARSYIGWPAVQAARPNAAHLALAELEQQGFTQLLVTQNVDGLHQKAGHRRVLELHGRLDEVICLSCNRIVSRAAVQVRLAELNPHLADAEESWVLAPDGDADASDSLVAAVQVPDCIYCQGVLKPHVVFFGDSVASERVEQVYRSIDASDALLVVGSSLMVFSGFRFCRYAKEQGKALACINRGQTRADEMFTLKIDEDCTEVLPAVAALMSGRVQ